MTSTLQQEAGRKLRFSANAMSLAQRLYGERLHHYMRTDSTTLSASGHRTPRVARPAALRGGVRHPTPRQYTRKVKNAQEAHEAIRPAGDTFRPRTPYARAGR